ncbi:MAG TPA: TonB-dependent receptor [Rhizomicrobium sp.]|jgi:iron complex outermembrane receptor protein
MLVQVRKSTGALAALLLLGGSGVLLPSYASAQTSGIETVTVTAEKRSEDLQKTPLTITVVSQNQLTQQNILTTTDLVRAVPSLTTSDEGVFQIRSIGTEGFGRSAEQSVSVVLDGVVLGRALTNSMYDLDHVEVLSGPQGTLFGKNATAGVINVVTKAPVLGEYEASAHIDAGDRDYIHSYVIGNIPLGDDAALRVSFHHDATGDVVYNTLFNQWDYNTDNGVRARLLWQPSSNLTINLSADYQKLGSNGVNGVADFAGVAVYTFAPVGSALATTLAGCGIVASKDNDRVCANSLRLPGVNLGDTYGRKNAGGSLQIDYNWGDLAFTSITALRQASNEDFNVHANIAGEFGDTLPQDVLDRNLVPYYAQTWSEEARVASPATDPVNFVAGLYYSKTDTHDEIDQVGALGTDPPPVAPFPPPGGIQFRRLINMFIHQQNYAAFGQVNWQITPALKVFAGGRVTHDDVSDFSFNSFPDAFAPYVYTGDTGFFSVLPVNSCTLAGGVPYDAVNIPCPAGTSTSAPGILRKTGLSGKIGAQYEIDPVTMVFASLAHGYKGPFMNESASYVAGFARQPLAITSEYPTDIELGVKTTVFDRFALDASLFTDNIRNFQTTIYVPPGPGQTVANFIQGNAPHAITRGVEVSFFGNLNDNLSINGGAIYNDAHFNPGFQVACSTGPCNALSQLPFAPRWKATIAGEYHQNLSTDLDGFVQSDLAYSGTYPYGSAPGFPGSPPRYLLGVRMGIRANDSGWAAAVFCRNCFDKRYPISAAPDGFASLDGGVVGSQASTYQFLTIDSYRIVGVTLDFKY